MKTEELARILEPFSAVVARRALSAAYKSLEFQPDKIRAISSYAALEAKATLGVKEPFFVDASFLAIAASLPKKQDLTLEVTDGVLSWSTSSTRGRLATSIIDEYPFPNFPFKGIDKWEPHEHFAQVVSLGSISCDAPSLLSLGLYGVQFDNREKDACYIITSDDATLSVAKLPMNLPGIKDVATFPPEALRALLSLMKNRDGKLVFAKQSCYYSDNTYRFLMRESEPLKHDLREIWTNFVVGKKKVAMPKAGVQAFVKRVAAMADSNEEAIVTLRVDKGKLVLEFEQGISGSDETYLVEGLKVPTMREIQLNAMQLARALAHTDHLIIDHMEQQVLVLGGDNPDFHYIISGKKA